jgi:hypothetical protein
MNFLANGQKPKGPTDKLCGRHSRLLRASEEPNEAMADKRPRWKDGSHELVGNADAKQSRCEVAFELNLQTESLVGAPPLLERSHEQEVSTRDRPARTGADARIEESGAKGEVRLALRPYGKRFKLCFPNVR